MIRIYLFVFLAAILSACSQTKNSGKVFPETSQSCQKTAHPNRYIVKKEDGSIFVHYENTREDMLKNFVEPNLSEIAFVEADQRVSKLDVVVAPRALETWGQERMGASQAWSQGITGSAVIVAVIDSGVDIHHPALSANIYSNVAEVNGTPGVDDDNNGFIDDIHGWNFDLNSAENVDESQHGTHVAGIIAAKHTSPAKGVAPDAIILPLDFMNEEGGFTSAGILSIRYAVDKGARIINASWGSSSCSALLAEEISSLQEKNVLFVAAAGNSGNNLSVFPEFPAAYINPTQITVSALSVRGFMAGFSNFGTLSNIMAPGEAIFSTFPGNSYAFLDGTSMAAPMVSGVAALLLSSNPNLTAEVLKSVILNSVAPGAFNVSTRGEVRIPNALQALSNLSL